MKKAIYLSASAIALFAAAPAFAQDNHSYVNQTGNDQYSTVVQDDGNGGHSSVTQTGTDDRANVTQSGSDNSAYVTQNGADTGQTNTYDGTNNSYSQGLSNIADVSQSGDNGRAIVDQTDQSLAFLERLAVDCGGKNSAADAARIFDCDLVSA